MNSSRPYLIRALYEWIVDNDCTPHILVDASDENVKVPEGFATDGQIVLNISPSAVIDLVMDNHWIRFTGRFSGQPFDVEIPVMRVLGAYARENGQGMVFEDDWMPSAGEDRQSIEVERPSGPPTLKVVK